MLNKKIRENNNIETIKIYQINEKNRKKIFEKYKRQNHIFNNIYYKINKNWKEMKKKEIDNSSTELNIFNPIFILNIYLY